VQVAPQPTSVQPVAVKSPLRSRRNCQKLALLFFTLTVLMALAVPRLAGERDAGRMILTAAPIRWRSAVSATSAD